LAKKSTPEIWVAIYYFATAQTSDIGLNKNSANMATLTLKWSLYTSFIDLIMILTYMLMMQL